VKIEPFALERWMTAHELSASYDIAESGILPLSINDLLAFEEPEESRAILEGLLETPLGYSEASLSGSSPAPSRGGTWPRNDCAAYSFVKGMYVPQST
jgi:hypothetical protein